MSARPTGTVHRRTQTAQERSRTTSILLGALALGCLLLAGCRRTAPASTSTAEAQPREVLYGEVGGSRLLLDVYPCDGAGPRPAAVLIHGGGWQTGDKSGEQAVARLLTEQGVACFAINYRLAPRHIFPSQVQDCARAVRWIRKHASEYNVDPRQIGAWGDSAGAHLALMLGTAPPAAFADSADPNCAQSARVQAVVDLYGPADFRDPSAWPLRTVYIARAFFGGGYRDPAVLAQASPCAYVKPGAARVLIVHGDADPIVPLKQSQDLAAALQAAKVPHELIVVKGAKHNLGGMPPEELAATYRRAAQWLQRQLSASPGSR